MKSSSTIQTVLIVCAILAVSAAGFWGWWRAQHRAVQFRGWVGQYDCPDLKTPSAAFTSIDISGEFQVLAFGPGGNFVLGKLTDVKRETARLELDMEVIHGNSGTLNALAIHTLQGTGRGVDLTGVTREGQTLYIHHCVRK